MHFSASTIAFVATVGFNFVQPAAAAAVEQRSIEARTWQLFTLQNYGAQGFPWQSSGKPGSYCGKTKPSNSQAWASLPFFDGADTVKCTWWNSWYTPLCNGRKPASPLPHGCRPPHSKPPTTTVPSQPSTTVVTTTAAGTTVVVPTTTAAATTTVVAPAPSPSADPNPYENPVCQGNYQTTYLNYTLVAPNGYWTGKTVGAAAQDPSYLTYTLAPSISDCLDACTKVEKCVFVNTYTDRNDDEAYLPKHTPGQITCAMFSTCVGTEKNDNWGGQDDPNDIVGSNGYCRSGACGGQ